MVVLEELGVVGGREVVVERVECWFEWGYVGKELCLLLGVGVFGWWGEWECRGVVGCGDRGWGWLLGKWGVLKWGGGECYVLGWI